MLQRRRGTDEDEAARVPETGPRGVRDHDPVYGRDRSGGQVCAVSDMDFLRKKTGYFRERTGYEAH